MGGWVVGCRRGWRGGCRRAWLNLGWTLVGFCLIFLFWFGFWFGSRFDFDLVLVGIENGCLNFCLSFGWVSVRVWLGSALFQFGSGCAPGVARRSWHRDLLAD